MAGFGAHFAVAFQADIEAIFSKYVQPSQSEGAVDEICLSEFLDQGNSDTDAGIYSVDVDDAGKNRDDDDDDKDKGDDDDDDDDDDDGQGSDASGPISSYLEDLPGRCSVTREQDAELAPMKNDTYTVSDIKHCLDDSETEGSVSDLEVSFEELQNESTDDLQYNCDNDKKRICDTTFVVNKSKVSSYSTHQGLTHFNKKPVSIVKPITSSGAKLSGKTLPSKEDHLTDMETSDKLDLAQAVLYSRNKIALALAGIVEGKRLHVKPSQVVSDESTCHTGEESEATSSDEESCTTCPIDKESCSRFREAGIGKKIKGELIGGEQIRTSVIRRPNTGSHNSGCKVLGLGTQKLMCSVKDQQPPFVKRRSLKLAFSSLDHLTNSSPHSVKLENGNFDLVRETTSPMKRRSAPLCKLDGSVKRVVQSKNVEGCTIDSMIMSPGSKAFGTPLGHQSTPLVQRPVSPAQQSSSSNSKSRRSSQVLRVNKDTVVISSCSSVEKKGKCQERHKETPGIFLEKEDTLSKNCCSTSKPASRTNTPDVVSGVKSSKRSQFFRTEDLLALTRENQDRGTHQASKPLLMCGEAVKKEERDFSPSVTEHRRDRRLSFDPVKGNSRPKFCPLSVALWNTPSNNRGPVFDMKDEGVTLDDRNETTEEQYDDELNYKRKLLKVRNPFRTRAYKERVYNDGAGIQSKEKPVKSLEMKISSPSGSSRKSVVLSFGLGSSTSPLRSNVRKKRARESAAVDSPDSLPTKHAKRGSPLPSNLEQCPIENTTSSQALGWWGRESTPMKGRNPESLRLEGFAGQNTKPLSPIRRTVAIPCGTVNDAVSSPCKGIGSCDKTFCFKCG
ncbi:hypothetical protein ACROYT_G012861 [Oculina patagonica]